MEQARTESRGAHRSAEQLPAKPRTGEKDKFSVKIMFHVEAKRRQFPVCLASTKFLFLHNISANQPIIDYVLSHSTHGLGLLTPKHLVKVTGCDPLLASCLEIGAAPWYSNFSHDTTADRQKDTAVVNHRTGMREQGQRVLNELAQARQLGNRIVVTLK